MPLINRVSGETLRLYLQNALGQKLGIINPIQLEKLFAHQPKMENTAKSAVKNLPEMKRTPMRVMVALLLQNPQLAQLPYDLGLFKALKRDVAGLDLLENLTALCRDNVGITMGQILEHYRDTNFAKPLEMLAIWDHLIEDEQIETTFVETLAYYANQLTEQRIEELIGKDRSSGLDVQEKQELAQLLSSIK